MMEEEYLEITKRKKKITDGPGYGGINTAKSVFQDGKTEELKKPGVFPAVGFPGRQAVSGAGRINKEEAHRLFGQEEAREKAVREQKAEEEFRRLNESVRMDEKADQRPRVIKHQNGDLEICGVKMDECGEEDAMHCWSYAIQTLVRYHMSAERYQDKKITAEAIRNYRNDDIDDLLARQMRESIREQVTGIKDEVPTILTDLLPDMAVHSVDMKADDAGKVREQIRRGLQHGPVIMLMENHYVTVVGIKGDIIQYKDNLKNHAIAVLRQPDGEIIRRYRERLSKQPGTRGLFLERVDREVQAALQRPGNRKQDRRELYDSCFHRVLQKAEGEELAKARQRYMKCPRHTQSNDLLYADLKTFIGGNGITAANGDRLELTWMERIVENAAVTADYRKRYENGVHKDKAPSGSRFARKYHNAVMEVISREDGSQVDTYILPDHISV